jgi:type I restriction enzyme S subunit
MVEWKKLGEVCELERGVRVIKKDLKQEGLIPVYQNSLTPLGYFDKSNYPENTPFVICAGAAGEVGFCSKPFWAADDCTCIMCSSAANNKYIYYCLLVNQHTLKSQVRKASVPRLSKDVIGKLLIPIPSLSEQNRIVGILDTFTASIDNLKEQIAQRRKQYEYYRDQLLYLEGKEVNEILSFGNDFELKARIGWQGLTKKEYRKSGEYKLVTGTDFTKNLRIDFDSCVFVEKERYEQDEYIKLKVGDVLITKDGTLGKVAYIDKLEMPATLNGGVFVVRDPKKKVIPKFIMFYLTSCHFKKWMKQNHTTGSIQHLTQKLLSSFTIPVLPELEQQRIVSILDTFEDSIQNLEAQLEQRQKQYEYYRNKLLTFE